MRHLTLIAYVLLIALSLAGCASSQQILEDTPQICKDTFTLNWVYYQIEGKLTISPATEIGASCFEVSPDTELTVTWDTAKQYDAVNLYLGSEDNVIAVDDDGRSDAGYTFTITLPAGTEPAPMWVKDAAGRSSGGFRIVIIVISPEE